MQCSSQKHHFLHTIPNPHPYGTEFIVQTKPIFGWAYNNSWRQEP